ncbi:glycine cleavage system protein GcvH [Marichromatium gracile]|uniref:Glycine cleavage system H protein n=2 Tax=Marichromatium TaxID=85076 RepID=W0DVE3_MARPU|nr:MULTISPECIES: glycine cleavage system protein GcvH [Marichromatium]AHF02570.1 glycine cleavage system protein H [Marichromatium purpuratum 984]KXX64353.1 glycine cleavage system protein H [Marichromatium gracile]MCF1183883.1 glycine cleavage system protein GcvH [Marichromatium gracile]
MSDIPADLKYTKSHEWVRDNGDGTVTVGITDHAQEALGDIVFVEVPETGRQVAAAEACAVVESVKAASDIYAPLAGEVVEANEALGDAPELINASAHAEGWIFRLAPSDAAALDALLDAAAYAKVLEEED